MNPVFVAIVILIAIALWFLLSFIFPILGKFLLRIWKNAKYNINKGEEKKNER